VLERVLTNDRADVPAVVQRRNLARQVPPTREAEDAVAAARRAVDQLDVLRSRHFGRCAPPRQSCAPPSTSFGSASARSPRHRGGDDGE
jgi:hypothetical protein